VKEGLPLKRKKYDNYCFKKGGAMKQFVLMLSILSLLIFGAWACSEQSEKSAKTSAENPTGTAETTQAGTLPGTQVATEKAKKVIEELQAAPQDSTKEAN
jgi:hypothetical protein